MNYIHTAISAEGFRLPGSNPQRWDLLGNLIEYASGQKADLLVIPAGFFTAQSENEVPEQVGRVAELANRASLAIIGGVDVCGAVPKQSPDIGGLVNTGSLPYFGFAVGRVRLEQGVDHPWRQTSIDNANAELVADVNLPGIARRVTVHRTTVGVLICGELFSSRARGQMARIGFQLILDIGHTGMGQGLIPAMRSLAVEARCPVAHSQHLAGSTGRSIHYISRDGEQDSRVLDGNPLVMSGEFWAGCCCRRL